MSREAVIVSAARTPVGRCRGALAGVDAIELGALALKEAVRKSGVSPDRVEEVIFGNLSNNDASNMARVVALEAGHPYSTTGITIDRQCASGLNAIALASIMIEAGHADIVAAGGVESDSNRPYLLERPNQPYQVNPPQWVTRRIAPKNLNVGMGITAENLAKKYEISREECDRFAVESHRKAANAQDAGLFHEQIIPVNVPGPKGKFTLVSEDECVRRDCSIETLSKLRPAFLEDGVCTAGNSSPMSDGAGAVVVMERKMAEQEGHKILSAFRGFAVDGCDPLIMGIGPVGAIKKVLNKTGLTLDEIDIIELNEAFAAQSIACIRELGLDISKLNVNGGALALGHPLAGTGGILVTKLVYELERRNARYGMVAFCIGGGQGAAAIFERV